MDKDAYEVDVVCLTCCIVNFGFKRGRQHGVDIRVHSESFPNKSEEHGVRVAAKSLLFFPLGEWFHGQTEVDPEIWTGA